MALCVPGDALLHLEEQLAFIATCLYLVHHVQK